MDKSADPPSAEKRRVCWSARDQYLACAKQYSNKEQTLEHCEKLKETFEASCPKAWVKHFLERQAWVEYKNEVYSSKQLKQPDTDDHNQRLSYLTVSKTEVDVLHCYRERDPSLVKVIQENAVNKCYALQAKWCHLEQQTALVVATYKGLLIFDGEGQLLMFWHNLCEEELENGSTFCRGIACVQKRYICVGCSNGKVFIITPIKNSYILLQTLNTQCQSISVMAGLHSTKGKNLVDFVCGGDNGMLCTYKSGSTFTFASHLTSKGETMPCTSLCFLPDGTIVSGYMNGKIRLFDSSRSVLLAEICAHARAVTCLDNTLALDQGSYLVISGSEDSFVRSWKISRQNQITVTQEWYTSLRDLRIYGIRFCDPTGKTFGVTAYDRSEVIIFSRI